MGAEALCRVRYGDQASQGKAMLETTELLFRGDFRLKVPFKSITALEVADGEMSIAFDGATAVFELGPKVAAAWADKIRNPRGRLDKLGVKPGARVAVLGVADEGFLAELLDRTSVTPGALDPDTDLIFYEADEVDDLIRLGELREALDRKGGIWVVSPKGKTARIKDTDVMAAARSAGLVDTKVVSFSDTHTALKLVIPVKQR